MKNRRILIFLFFCISSYSQAEFLTSNDKILSDIKKDREAWLSYLSDNIITSWPKKNTVAAEIDRITSNKYRKILEENSEIRERANKDKSQDKKDVYGIFFDLLPKNLDTINPKEDIYKKVDEVFDEATRAKDKFQNNNKIKTRSMDFIFKNYFQRGRPWEVIKDGKYIDNYENNGGSSFPSGHTLMATKQL